MKKHVLFLSVLILCMVVMAACSPSPGYRIYGMAKDSRFEGKTVYLTDMQSNAIRYDSTVVKNGKFGFADSVDVAVPYIRVLSVQIPDSIMPYCLPVVIENGNITALLGDRICTSGTGLNDRLQDFLLGLENSYLPSPNIRNGVRMMSGRILPIILSVTLKPMPTILSVLTFSRLIARIYRRINASLFY